MSDEPMDESPYYRKATSIDELKLAQTSCPACKQFPMIEIAGSELLCPNCRKQFVEGPIHNFVRIVYENTTGGP